MTIGEGLAYVAFWMFLAITAVSWHWAQVRNNENRREHRRWLVLRDADNKAAHSSEEDA